MTAATVSHHLSTLRDAGLVLDEKKGKFIYYELNTSVLDELLGWLTSLKGGTDS
jgi:DNA-binding transcriptional ArsR family regulator